MKCSECGRPATFKAKRGSSTRLVADLEHELCRRCYRDQMNRKRAQR